jgi:hypothetical protein
MVANIKNGYKKKLPSAKKKAMNILTVTTNVTSS